MNNKPVKKKLSHEEIIMKKLEIKLEVAKLAGDEAEVKRIEKKIGEVIEENKRIKLTMISHNMTYQEARNYIKTLDKSKKKSMLYINRKKKEETIENIW